MTRVKRQSSSKVNEELTTHVPLQYTISSVLLMKLSMQVVDFHSDRTVISLIDSS